MHIEFVASFSPIVEDIDSARTLYGEVLGVDLEVADVAAAAKELSEGGQQLLHGPRTEPWGQTVARFLSADGLLVAVCHTPHLREGRHLTDSP